MPQENVELEETGKSIRSCAFHELNEAAILDLQITH